MARATAVLIPLFSLFLSTVTLAQPAADIAVTIEAPDAVLPNERFTVRGMVTNHGPDLAEDVHVWMIAGSTECSDGQAALTLEPGETRSYSCQSVIPKRMRVYSHGAYISAQSYKTADPVRENNHVQKDVFAITLPDLFVQPTTFPVAKPGLPFGLDVGYGNAAYTTATNTVLTLETPTRFLQVPEVCTSTGTRAVCSVGDVTLGPVKYLHFEILAPDESAKRTQLDIAIDAAEDDERPQDDVFTASTYTYRTFFVTNTGDSGSGSLRAAIEAANGDCNDTTTTFPCLIAFRIPQTAAAWHTITPLSPLPRLVRTAQIDGTTQRQYFADSNPDGPEVELNGAQLTQGNGIEIGCTGQVRGLAINGFPDNGVFLPEQACTQFGLRTVEENYIGTDPTGTRAVPNHRGVWVATRDWTIQNNIISGNERAGVFVDKGMTRIAANKIGLDRELRPLGNGASGIGILTGGSGSDVTGNYIGFNEHFGVAIAPDAQNVSIGGNSIQGNHQKGIDWGIDGVLTTTPVPIPEITSVRFENGMTIIDGTTTASGTFAPQITVYANDAPDPSGYGEGQYVLGTALALPNAWRLVSPQDLRGKWITATATRVYYVGWLRDQDVAPDSDTQGFMTTTSEFSLAVEAK